jgi:nucleoid DNA-binding protein
MTKREMVVRIANETGLIQQDIHEVIQRSLDLIIESLANGRNVELRNFGVFQLKTRKQRIGRNPNRPEHVVEIPACQTVKFKPGKIMKQRISG